MSLQKRSGAVVIQATGKLKDDTTNLRENDYRRIILQLQNEIKSKDARLKGVHALTLVLQSAEEQCKSLTEKSSNYERLLKRAEARIAQLNQTYGIGPQTAFNRGVVIPGVSRKDFELVTQENVKLKDAFRHIESTNLEGHEIVLKNKELYDLVSMLKEEISDKVHYIKGLKTALEERSLGIVPELEQKVMHLEKSLYSKQLFCETLIKEIDILKKKSKDMEQVQEQHSNPDLIDGIAQQNELVEENDHLKSEIGRLTEVNTSLNKHAEDIEKHSAGLEGKIKSLEVEKAKLSEEVAALSEKLQQERNQIVNLNKDHTELNKKCNGFFQQVVSLNSKQKESEEEANRMKRAFDHQKAELEEKKGMIHLMTESLKSYEDDFRRENEEKAKYQKLVDKAEQETSRMKRENMSHIATIKHLEDEFERMDQLLKEERRKGKDNYNKFGSSLFPVTAAAGGQRTRSLFPDNPRRPVVVADGGGIDESDDKAQERTPSMPVTKSESSNVTPSLIECPYCSRSYPYHLIEGHVQDCMEDSLYDD